MDKPESRIRIGLTDDQRKQIREASGHDISTLDVTVTELEERIAPTSLNYGGIKYNY